MHQQNRLRSVASVFCGVLISAACGFDKLDGLTDGGSEVLVDGSAGTANSPATDALTDDTSRDDPPEPTNTAGTAGAGGQGGKSAVQQAGSSGSTSTGGKASGVSGSTGAGGARFFFCSKPVGGAGGASGSTGGGAGGETASSGAGGETASSGASGQAGFAGSGGTAGDSSSTESAGSGGESGEGGSSNEGGSAGAAGSSSAGAGGTATKINITQTCYNPSAPTTERCTITASLNNDSPSSLQFDERPTKAFDGLVGTKWLTFWAPIDGAAPSGEVWIQVELPAAAASKVMTSYALVSANDFADRDPKDFQVLGSTDGTTWTVLDTRCGIFWPNSERFYRMNFVPQKSGAYRFYRLLIGNNAGNRDTIRHNGITQLAEFELYSSQ